MSFIIEDVIRKDLIDDILRVEELIIGLDGYFFRGVIIEGDIETAPMKQIRAYSKLLNRNFESLKKQLEEDKVKCQHT